LEHFNRRTVTAAVYTNCDEAELRVNGKKMGRRKPGDFANGIIEWTFEYTEGEVRVIGFLQGKEVCAHTLKTAGPAQNIVLAPDKTNLAAGGLDIAHVEVTVTDANGIPCPNGELLIEFALKGDGEILGACSPDLNAGLGFTLPKVLTSGGKALLMIRPGRAGTLELSAYSETLDPASLQFTVR
jgi:beta-galactosidase